MMFSATMPQKIQQLASAILNDPVEIKIAVSRPTDKIDQSAYVCHEEQKTDILKHLFRTVNSQRVIVFAASKINVKNLARELRRQKMKVGEMHSDLEQDVREDVMLDFRAGRIDILVATDIVARGIDIDDITMVVNYDVPREAEDYVHRIGRTARANTDGKAVTLVSQRDQTPFGRIEHFLGYEVRKEPVPGELGETPEYKPRLNKSAAGKHGSFGRNNRTRHNHSSRNNKPKTHKQAADSTSPSATTDQKQNNKRRWHHNRRRRSSGDKTDNQ